MSDIASQTYLINWDQGVWNICWVFFFNCMVQLIFTMLFLCLGSYDEWVGFKHPLNTLRTLLKHTWNSFDIMWGNLEMSGILDTRMRTYWNSVSNMKMTSNMKTTSNMKVTTNINLRYTKPNQTYHGKPTKPTNPKLPNQISFNLPWAWHSSAPACSF